MLSRRLLSPTKQLSTRHATLATSSHPPPAPRRPRWTRRTTSPTSPSSSNRSPPPLTAEPAFDRSSLQARFLPFPTPPGMSWNAVLEGYARLKRPQKELPPGVWLASDDKTLAIFDGFEKAKYHFLVMPRDPFPLEGGGTVPSSHLESLTKLLKSEHKVEVLKALQAQAEEVKEMIQDEMQKEEGWIWDVQVGFHAVESMKHVHLHVISSDLISPKLKNKKHYNSFHPKLGFFLHLDEVLEGVEDGSFSLQPTKVYESLLKDDLVSLYTGDTHANIPKLKAHLEEEWKKLGRKKKKEIEAKRVKEEEKRGVTRKEGEEKVGEQVGEEEERKGKRQKTDD